MPAMPLWTPYCRAQLIGNHDGDTMTVLLDQLYNGRTEQKLRLADVPAPEVNQVGGSEATAQTNAWLHRVTTRDPARRWPLGVLSQPTKRKAEPEQVRTFVRYVSYVYDIATGACLNQHLIDFLALHPEWPPGKAP